MILAICGEPSTIGTWPLRQSSPELAGHAHNLPAAAAFLNLGMSIARTTKMMELPMGAC